MFKGIEKYCEIVIADKKIRETKFRVLWGREEGNICQGTVKSAK